MDDLVEEPSEEVKDYLRSVVVTMGRRWLPHADHFVVSRQVIDAARELAEELANAIDQAPRPSMCFCFPFLISLVWEHVAHCSFFLSSSEFGGNQDPVEIGSSHATATTEGRGFSSFPGGCCTGDDEFCRASAGVAV